MPWVRLATINPPLAAGALYCVLDLLAVQAATWLRRVRAGTFNRLPAAWLRAATLRARRARTVAGT